MITAIDLNADVGEGAGTDTGLLEVVSSASVACGAHAGDPATMLEVARVATLRGVALGAHPSYPDREGFGRRDMDMAPDDLLAALVCQVGAMAGAAAAAGAALGFVKPHGALYNRAASDPSVAETVVEAVRLLGLGLLCPAGSEMQRRAAGSGVATWAEAFADRAYLPDSVLAPRSAPGAVIHDITEVATRAVTLARHGRVTALDGTELDVAADSICVHGDTPGALDLATAVRRALEEAGVAVRPFSVA